MEVKEQLEILILAYNELRADADQFFEKEPNVDFWADRVVRAKTVEDKLKLLDFIDKVSDLNSVIWAVLDILDGHNISVVDAKQQDQEQEPEINEPVNEDDYVTYLKNNHKEFYDDWKIRRIDDLLDKLEATDSSNFKSGN